MSLVACPECAQQVSTGAKSCPHCGMVLPAGTPSGSSPSSAPSPAAGFAFAPITAPSAEQTLWEGGPSMALVYGKILQIVVRAIILYTVGYLLVVYALPAIAAASADFQSLIDAKQTALDWVIFGILTIMLIPPLVALSASMARLRTTHYKVTTQRIVLEQGVLSRSLEEIDMRSVDDTEFRQSFLERIFKIGEVWIVSTDKVAPKIVLHGIHDPRGTRELIRSTAYEASQRQLFTRST
jgi:membrane protein YdbS with pleckstrin-like domain